MFKESEKIELKESFAEWKEIIISLAAFANRNGGKVIVGVNDNGEFTNLQLGKNSIEDFVNKLKQNTDPVLYPSINVKEFGLGEYVEIEVPESDNKPVFAFDKAYIRTGKTNVKVSNALLRELISRYKTPDFDKQFSGIKYDKNIIDTTWISSLNERYFKINTSAPEQILMSLNVLSNERFTNAGYLCFANSISDFPNAVIRMARFKGETPDVFLDMKNSTVNLIQSVAEVFTFITRSVNMSVEIGKQAERVEKWDYPIEALREGFINAIVHRDYTDPGNIQIRIFDDRIEIWSPGLLPRELNLSRIELESRSIPRNKKIAEIFYRLGLIENWGTGFVRMINQCKINGNPRPIFEEKSGAFVITFIKIKNEGINEGAYEGINEGINEGAYEGINEGINKLYLYLKNNEGLRVNQISETLKIPSKTLERWISALKNENKIEYRGSKKTGGYFALK